MQIVYIVDEAFTPMAGAWMSFSAADIRRQVYGDLHYHLAKEYGVARLAAGKGVPDHADAVQRVQDFIVRGEIERVLDLIDVALHLAFEYATKRREFGLPNPHTSVEELNARFREHGVGYQFISPQIIRVDSEYLHSEAVIPALRLLEQSYYAGAQKEFLKAHEHYRKGNAEDALSNCLKAFESVMKSICNKRGWTVEKKATATRLIKACLDNGLIPSFWEQHYQSLRSLLESGVPTGRNNLGGHGQGTNPRIVPDYLAAYMLHMTAAAIVFLADAEKNLK